MSSTDTTSQYVDNQPLTIYSIVSSPTPITKSEIRYVQAGQDLTQYSTVEMNVAPLQVSNTTYIVSGTIPAETMHAPAVSYWVDVQNTAGKTSDSDVYSVGVSQDQLLQAKLELDTRFAKAEGSLRHPQAYFTNNGTSPVYGYIALIVNGTQIFASQPQVFGLGQTQVSLEWHMPSMGSVEQYVLQARAEIYGQTVATQSMPVVAFPGTVTTSLSKLGHHRSNVDWEPDNCRCLHYPLFIQA
ncbi:hypothetical protein DYY67_1428 [Candidatus Nitrosotalea sp. TS]|uniref:hypothetical protein n=1 Tax=Candidatus Nitrosotalea sp. TS TaxID=2341020 RepID=UPI00140BE708|nr:hypothetical protein [Candidatus Nitrosotalea sp. TS]NHI04053.1 hypothetical protein [Candidatus Nitrosotalea sp. TS]